MEGVDTRVCAHPPPNTHTSNSEDSSPFASSLAGGINNNKLVSWFPWDLVKSAVMVAFCLVWKGWIISQTHHHPLGSSAGRRIWLQGGQGSWPPGKRLRVPAPSNITGVAPESPGLALLPVLLVFWTLRMRVCVVVTNRQSCLPRCVTWSGAQKGPVAVFKFWGIFAGTSPFSFCSEPHKSHS